MTFPLPTFSPRVSAIGGIDANTLLMLHMDGADASTTFTDSSSSAHTLTANGDAQVDTAQSKFGGASYLGDGTGDYLQSADSANWDVASDYTVDFWIRPASVGSTVGILGHGGFGSGSGGWDIRQDFAEININFYETTGVVRGSLSTTGTSLAVNTWTHVAVVFSSGDLYIYINGVLNASDTSFPTYVNSSHTLEIGAVRHSSASGNPTFSFSGHLDEFRISNVARWTSNFTPPSGPYTS